MVEDRVQRRLAAIMAADIVGYSRMMERDEAGTLSRIKAFRREAIDPAIKARAGRIVKVMGDGLLIEFPSAVEAVVCGVAIQQEVLLRNKPLPDDQKLIFRIGINLGDLIIEGDDIFGDGVNIAARLESLAPAGGLAISRAIRDQIRDKLALPFEDRGEQQVKNIARPIRVFMLSAESFATLAPSTSLAVPVRQTAFHWRALAGACVAVAMACGVGLVWWYGAHPVSPVVVSGSGVGTMPTTSAGAPNLSIVVLPFANLGNDKEQDYLADGITEDLTTDLARIAGSFVIARNTAFTYKGKPTDVKQIGRDLNVRYVLEGSVRRTENQLRVNAQLIDADTGTHLWAERFDAGMDHLTTLQDQVTARIARTLDLKLFETEARRAQRERPTNPTATDLAMQGWALVNRPSVRENVTKAAALFEQALKEEPGHAAASLGLGRASFYFYTGRIIADPSEMLERAEQLVRKVIADEPGNGRAYNVLGDVLNGKKQTEAALAAMQKAVELNPSDAGGTISVGYLLAQLGRFDEAPIPLLRSMSISPRDPQVWVAQFWLGNIAFATGRDAEAMEWTRKGVDSNPASYLGRRYRAGVVGVLGTEAEAKMAATELIKLRPDVTLTQLRDESPSNHPLFRKAIWDRFMEGWKRGGIPE